MTHFRLDVTITSITSITSGFWPDVTLDGSLPGAHPNRAAGHGLLTASAWRRQIGRDQSLSLHLTFTGHARLGARTQAR